MERRFIRPTSHYPAGLFKAAVEIAEMGKYKHVGLIRGVLNTE